MTDTTHKLHWWTLHHWGLWTDVGRGELQQRHWGATEYVSVGVFVQQERVCQKCGKRQVREVRT
jgi:hypothetical protein